jgi:hypothetical protein
MSYAARDWVWERSRARGTARLVMLSLADRVTGPDCTAYSSIGTLVRRTGAGRTAVRGAIDCLLTSGELEVIEGITGPLRSTVYRLAGAVGWAPEGSDSDPGQTSQGGRIPTRGGSHSDPLNREEQRRTEVEQRESAGVRETRPPATTPVTTTLLPLPHDWQPDDDLLGWAMASGHAQRLGLDGLDLATAKWVAHRTDTAPRSAAAWRADWQTWIARERPEPTPAGPQLRVIPGGAANTSPVRLTPQQQYEALLMAAAKQLQAEQDAQAAAAAERHA